MRVNKKERDEWARIMKDSAETEACRTRQLLSYREEKTPLIERSRLPPTSSGFVLTYPARLLDKRTRTDRDVRLETKGSPLGKSRASEGGTHSRRHQLFAVLLTERFVLSGPLFLDALALQSSFLAVDC